MTSTQENLDAATEEAIAVSMRVMTLVHTIGLLHTQWNEFMVGPTQNIAPTSSCRLFDNSTTGITTLVTLCVFILYTTLEAIGVLRYPGTIDMPNIVWQCMSVLLGSYFIMAIKPSTWFMSFEWTDCSTLYDTSLVGGRCATTAYVLIFSASACMLRDGMQPKSLLYGIWPTKLSNTAIFWIMHVFIPFAFFFSSAVSMWLFLKD